MTRRLGLLVLVLLLPTAQAQKPRADMQGGRYIGDHAGPAALDSPAWRDLLALPAREGDTLAFHAAAVALRWGREAEAHRLQRNLLLLHARALAGHEPPANVSLALGLPAADPATLQAAWDAGLSQALAESRWGDSTATPPPGARALPGRAGFWRMPGERLAVAAQLRNGSPFAIALPAALQLRLRSGAGELLLPCTLRPARVRWMQGDAASAWCETPAAVAANAWGTLADAKADWHSTIPPDEAAQQPWVDLLAGRQPMSVGLLVERHAHCRDLKNCRQGAMPTTEELAAQRLESRMHEAETRGRQASRERRDGRARGWAMLAWLVGGFAVYVLVARAMGTLLASGLIVGLSVALSLWAFSGVRGGGWGGLALLFVGIAAPVYGLLLAAAYRWLYRRFLAPE